MIKVNFSGPYMYADAFEQGVIVAEVGNITVKVISTCSKSGKVYKHFGLIRNASGSVPQHVTNANHLLKALGKAVIEAGREG